MEYYKNKLLINIKYVDNNGVEQIEQWNDVVGYEGLYAVSNLGRVKSLARAVKYNKNKKFQCIRKERILSQKISNGYCCVSLQVEKKKQFPLVHRLVAFAFISNPKNKPMVNHVSGNKKDNRHTEIEWSTAKENIHHARDFLNSYKGESGGKHKLTTEQVLEIREGYVKYRDGYLIEMSKKHGISISGVSKICRRESWKHI